MSGTTEVIANDEARPLTAALPAVADDEGTLCGASECSAATCCAPIPHGSPVEAQVGGPHRKAIEKGNEP
jgi:hypothetical protein